MYLPEPLQPGQLRLPWKPEPLQSTQRTLLMPFSWSCDFACAKAPANAATVPAAKMTSNIFFIFFVSFF